MLQIAGHSFPPGAQVRFRFLLPHLFAIHHEALSDGQTGHGRFFGKRRKEKRKKKILTKTKY
jgi:hypothetical protein